MSATTPESLLEHAAWVRRLARGLVAEAHGAADLEQETWLAALTHASGGSTSAALGRGWFARVAANLAHRSRRTRARVAEREERVARSEAQPSETELIERADLTRALVSHVVALEEPYRSTLLLRYFEELSPSAIALREKIPLRTVNTRLARGLAQLRERLDRSRDRDSWLPALLALCDPPRAPLPPVPTLLLMNTSTKIVGAASIVLVLVLAGGTWLAMRPEEPGGKRVEPRLAHDATPAPATATPVLSEPPFASERTAAELPTLTTTPAVQVSALHGRVVDRSGRPISGARVALSAVSGTVFNWSAGAMPEPLARTVSDQHGVFSIELEPSSVGELSVAARGFGTAHAGRRRTGDFVEIVLEPAGAIAGRVTRHPNAAPVEGVKVIVRGTDNAFYNPVLGEAVTDAHGAYRVEDLAARDYWVWLASRAGGSSLVGTVSVASGATVVRDCELSPGREVLVRGRIADSASSEPIGDALVSVNAESCRTDASGEFELRAIVAEVATRIPIKASARGFVEKNVQVAADELLNVAIALDPGESVVGRLIGPDGSPIEGARVVLFDGGIGPSPTGGRQVRTGPGGAFEIDGLRRGGPYGMVLIAESLAAAAFELPELESGRTDLGEIRLAPAATLVARIVDDAGRPWTDCEVRLYGDGAGRARFTDKSINAFDERFGLRMNRVSTEGRAVFGELAAGEYTLRTRIAGRSEWVESVLSLEEGEVRDDVELMIPRGLTLRGRTLDPEGRPVAGVFVLVQRPGVDGVAGSANTGSDGVFEIAGLASGEHVVRTTIGVVAAPEARKRFASGKWTATADSEPLELVMPLIASVEGRVVDVDGQPLAGVSVSAWDAGAGMPDATGRTNERGEFRLSVRAGASFELRANVKVGSTSLKGSLASVLAGSAGIELRLVEV